MTDQAFLYWLHQRMLNIYGEDFDLDYMSKLRSICRRTPSDQATPNAITLDDWKQTETSIDGSINQLQRRQKP